jgi:hypothetical protein
MIKSGTTTERVLRLGILTALVCGYAVWSLWDGYVAYPRANVRSACRDKIGIEPPQPLPVSNPRLTEALGRELRAGASTDELANRFGPPAIRQDDHAYYFGYGGSLLVAVGAGKVTDVTWIAGPKHLATDLTLQKTIGFTLLPLAVFLIARFARAVTARAILNENGLKVPGRPPIPYDAITELRSDRKGRAGRFELTYSRGGRCAVLILDDYILKEAPAIVREICRTKGLPDPTGERHRANP